MTTGSPGALSAVFDDRQRQAPQPPADEGTAPPAEGTPPPDEGTLPAVAAGGQAGVERALMLLRAEFERTLALTGCSSVPKLGRGYVNQRR